ncbi:hypothetical protein Salat_2080700 [Sesamum alatum]|uniref:Uncharacterized protein n=1 Tax=Sesamum alatum TaxID=300844 RepID=A0AAE1Y119_9LAMI|nr:hypothetical protein Salat_2080700 [Sesamum alatum]
MARFLLLYVQLSFSSLPCREEAVSQKIDPISPTGTPSAHAGEFGSIPSPAPSWGGADANGGPGLMRIWSHHHSADKSVAGGDVILGGFATALVAAIVCYIRITMRSKHSQT